MQQSEKSERFRAGLVLSIAVAHFLHDAFTALLAPLLPLIIQDLGISLFQAGTLAVAIQLPSLFNPFLGYLTDRYHIHKTLVIVAPASTGVLMCLMGLAPGYAMLVILLLTAGLSVAAMHVAGPVLIGQYAGREVGRGMGFFMLGGELARTAGPLLAVQLVSTFGFDGMWRAAPVAVASSLILWWRLAGVGVRRSTGRPSPVLAVWRDIS